MPNFWKTLERPFLVLAPMQDVTDFVFREIIAETAKPDVLFTEFTPVDNMFSKGYKKNLQCLKYSEKQRPIVAQIWGIAPEAFFKSAELIRELGFDGIDINMGCPDKAVVKKGSGAALINNMSLASELIAAAKAGAGDIPVSVKTRLGFDADVIEDWLQFLLEQKIAALSVHARTAKELSKGPARWEELKKVVKIRNKISPDTLIIGNGDVSSYADAIEKHKVFGVDGIMVGRGIFSNPWFFKNSLEPEKHSTEKYLELLLKHASLYNSTWGNEKNFHAIKKFFSMYIKSFRGAKNLKQELMLSKDFEELKAKILFLLSQK